MSEILKKIEYLSGFMTHQRDQTLRDTLNNRTDYIRVCLENTFHPQNASAVVRSCEAFGIQNIHTIETLVKFSPNVHIVRGTDKWVDIHPTHSENPTHELISKLKGKGYRIIATSPHINDTTPEKFDVTAGKFALFFGTEHAGISDEVINSADEFIKIPMYGFVESLNVSVCAAILLYNLSQRVRESVKNWQIDDDTKNEILFRWMMETVKDSKNIMKRYEHP